MADPRKDKPKKMKRLAKRERVMRAFSGGEVDRRPFTLWHPFGLTHMKGESLAAAALSFAATYQVDLVRLPTVRDLPLPPQTSLDRPHDLTQIEELSPRAGYWQERLNALNSASKMAEGRVAIFESVSDPLTSLGYVCPKEVLRTCELSHPNFLEKALTTVTDGLKGYLREALKKGHADGLVMEVGSATFEAREKADFERVAKPFLKDLLNFVRGISEAPIWLHVAGKRIYLDPLLDLPHDMLSWSHLSQGPALDRLPKGYKGRLAGGINEQAVLDMSFQDIRRHVEQARDCFVAMLCPGDAFPGDTGHSKLAALSNFLCKRDREPDPIEVGVGRTGSVIDSPDD